MGRMQAQFDVVQVNPDCVRQQLYSCVAIGKLYDDGTFGILAAALQDVDITEVSSPQKATKLCAKYGLMAGDSFDLRDGYDLSDEKTHALVVSRIRSTKPTMVIGSPPCKHFLRTQQLNLHVHGLAWAMRSK